MRTHFIRFSLAAGALLASAGSAHAQIHVTPMLGGYWQANDFEDLREEGQQIRASREGAFAMGVAAELGSLRFGLAYASDATINEEGVEGELGTASLVALSADLALRPLPRILGIQPYGLVGLGLKRADYSWERDGLSDAFGDSDDDLGGHLGIGADWMFGRFGVTAEVSDYITKDDTGDWNQHDAFAMVGLRIRL